MNALELLKKDHEHVNLLCEQADQATDIQEKASYFMEIRRELETHTDLEENLLYPLFADRPETRDLVERFFDAHQEIRDILEDIQDTPDVGEADDEMDELVQAISDHVAQEENEFFPLVERFLSQEELNDLGDKMEDSRSEMSQAA